MSQSIVINTRAWREDAVLWKVIKKHSRPVPPEIAAECDRAVQEAIAEGELERQWYAQQGPRLPTGRIE